MNLHSQAASSALELERSEEAIEQYRRAFERAIARDDAGDIGDYGYDLAVAQLDANQPKQALASVGRTKTELARRGAPSFAALDLAEATAYYRIGDKEASDRLASKAEAGGDAAAAARAAYLRGLIADDDDNAEGLDQAVARLANPTSTDQQADAAELIARQQIRQGEFNGAATAAEHAADLRRDILDYRGMARALSVAAYAEQRGGDAEAASSLYIRAGQSAAALGDSASARSWLRRGMTLTKDSSLQEAAKISLASLKASPAPADH
ncbi:MAG TPA: hypothetical protein VEK35_10840 [Roseiarcus sp.]|nr:hypothetical protein [Roseiarcus sp.]